MKNISDADAFLSKIKTSKKLFVVDFYADWCGPCKRLSPVLERMSEEHTSVVFCKVDVDEKKKLSERYKIRCMPTVLFIKGGVVVARVEGCNAKTILDHVKSHK